MVNKLRNKLQIVGYYFKLPRKNDVICKKVRFGSDYAGYNVCPHGLNSESIVYSFGVGEDISFDLAMISTLGTNVFAFDPTPKSIEWIRQQEDLPEKLHFYPYGIADYDGVAYFNPPKNPLHVSHTMLDRPRTADNAVEGKVYTLLTIMNMLQHSRIDVVKMDIEGAEYAVLENILEANINVGQFLIEFHHRFENVGWLATKNAIILLKSKGYQIFDVSANLEEYSFIKL